MVTIEMDECDLLEMFEDRVRFWTDDEDIIKLKKWIDFFSNNILSDDNIYNVEDLEELENMSEDTQEKMEKLESIKEYIGNILEQIDDYRKIANKDAQGKTYRL